MGSEKLTDADVFIPILHSNTADCQFEWHDNGPLHDVVPAHGETPGRIDKASRVSVEATRDREHDSEFAESVDRVEHHDTNDAEVDKERSGTSSAEGLAGADEETGADRTADGNHVQMASLHAPVERVDGTAGNLTLLEGAEVEAIAGPEVLFAVGTSVSGKRWRRLLLRSADLALLFRGRHGDVVLLILCRWEEKKAESEVDGTGEGL